jgi:hypothetical protein
MSKIAWSAQILSILFMLVNSVQQGETYTDKLLGSPLIILIALIVINIVALIYRRIRG